MGRYVRDSMKKAYSYYRRCQRNAPEAMPPNIKSLNYLNNILAKIEANAKGGDEAIMFDVNGNLSEGSGDNIFVVKNGQIITPRALNNLRGITRAARSKLRQGKVSRSRK